MNLVKCWIPYQIIKVSYFVHLYSCDDFKASMLNLKLYLHVQAVSNIISHIYVINIFVVKGMAQKHFFNLPKSLYDLMFHTQSNIISMDLAKWRHCNIDLESDIFSIQKGWWHMLIVWDSEVHFILLAVMYIQVSTVYTVEI
jgi:hypothetical protein